MISSTTHLDGVWMDGQTENGRNIYLLCPANKTVPSALHPGGLPHPYRSSLNRNTKRKPSLLYTHVVLPPFVHLFLQPPPTNSVVSTSKESQQGLWETSYCSSTVSNGTYQTSFSTDNSQHTTTGWNTGSI